MQLLIENAKIVTETTVIESGCILLDQGKIRAIFSTPLPSNSNDILSECVKINANQKYLIPGIVDIHTDAIDKEISPRTGANFPIAIAFKELEKKMSACGITTVYHSLHLGYDHAEQVSRSNKTRKQIFQEVHAETHKNTIINNKIHLRFEITGIEAFETALDLINDNMVELFSFMDHTPGQGQVSENWYKNFLSKNGFSEQEAHEHLAKVQSKPKLDGARQQQLIELLQSLSIPIASHDDDSVEKVETSHKLGLNICEFPITLEAAQRAKELNMSVVGGAANVLRGGSLSGNINVLDGVNQKVIDSLCSDYYPSSIIHSIFKITRSGQLTLPDAVNLASLNPAYAVGLHQTKGSIAEGKDADLVIVDFVDNMPFVSHTIVNGTIVFQSQIKHKHQLHAIHAN